MAPCGTAERCDVPVVELVPLDHFGDDREHVAVRLREEMAREYQQRYGVPFDVLHNGAADELFTDSPAEGQTDDAIVVRYIGSLLRDQHWEAIEDFAEAVACLRGGSLGRS